MAMATNKTLGTTGALYSRGYLPLEMTQYLDNSFRGGGRELARGEAWLHRVKGKRLCRPGLVCEDLTAVPETFENEAKAKG